MDLKLKLLQELREYLSLNKEMEHEEVDPLILFHYFILMILLTGLTDAEQPESCAFHFAQAVREMQTGSQSVRNLAPLFCREKRAREDHSAILPRTDARIFHHVIPAKYGSNNAILARELGSFKRRRGGFLLVTFHTEDLSRLGHYHVVHNCHPSFAQNDAAANKSSGAPFRLFLVD